MTPLWAWATFRWGCSFFTVHQPGYISWKYFDGSKQSYTKLIFRTGKHDGHIWFQPFSCPLWNTDTPMWLDILYAYCSTLQQCCCQHTEITSSWDTLQIPVLSHMCSLNQDISHIICRDFISSKWIMHHMNNSGLWLLFVPVVCTDSLKNPSLALSVQPLSRNK